MFGLDKKTLQKKNIIEILDMESQPITSKELERKLGSSSSATILSTCRELQECFKRIYPDGKVQLLIEKRGVSLKRHASSLQYFHDDLFSSDLSYAIIKELILKRRFNTDSFCFSVGTSISSLRRKVSLINETFSHFGLHITVSSITSLSGSELDIRYISYIFLYGIHRQFSRIPWAKDKEAIRKTARDVLDYLHIKHLEVSVETLSIVIYTINLSRMLGKKIEMSEKQDSAISSLKFPTKPKFLYSWQETDWEYLLLLMYISDTYDLSFEYQNFASKETEILFHTIAEHWITTFETFFIKLTEKKKKIIYIKIHKQFIASSCLSLNDSVSELMDYFDFHRFEGMYPNYSEIFKKFWAAFLGSGDFKMLRTPFYRIRGLLLCLYLCSTREMLPKVNLFLHSDQDGLYNNYLKQRVEQALFDKFNVHFRSDPDRSDFILSTVPIAPEFLKPRQKMLLIKVPIRNSDINELMETISG